MRLSNSSLGTRVDLKSTKGEGATFWQERGDAAGICHHPPNTTASYSPYRSCKQTRVAPFPLRVAIARGAAMNRCGRREKIPLCLKGTFSPARSVKLLLRRRCATTTSPTRDQGRVVIRVARPDC